MMIFIVAILNTFIFKISNIYILSGVLLLFLILIKFLIGFEKDRSVTRKDAMMNIFIIVMLYHIITYIIGIFVGFIRTGYSSSITGIINNIMPVLILILIVELLRYAINRKCGDNKKLLVLSTIVFILLDLMIQSYVFNLTSGEDLVKISSLIILPTISKNILLGKIVITSGYYPSILYRLLIEIPVYLLPIFPDFNEYITAVISFLLPLVTFLFMNIMLKKFGKKEKQKGSSLNKNIFSKITVIVLLMLLVLIVYLTSGLFKYSAISIGSGSMEPNLNIGDVVIYEAISSDYDNLTEDDILVYKKDGIVIVHRVNEIINNSDNIQFITKGDNNDDPDEWIVEEKDIIGKVILKVKYIGYPTIMLNKLIE